MKKSLRFIAAVSSVIIIHFLPSSNLQVLCTESKEGLTPSGIPFSCLEQQVDEYMDKFIGKNISGAQVSVCKDVNIILSKGYGIADRTSNKPVTTRSAFNYASISKLFIWVSAMQLWEDGKLDLNEDIRKYLPSEYPVKIRSHTPVTFLNLMNHNAGFDLITKNHIGSNVTSLKEAIPNYYKSVQCFAPGSIQAYSNYGANLAAYIVERISGMPFYKYVRKNIFKPCKMNAGYKEVSSSRKVMKNRVKGYKYSGSKGFESTKRYNGGWLYPSGSVLGTADDLSRFFMALVPAKGRKSVLFKKDSTLNKMLSISYSPTGGELFSVHHGFWGSDGNYRGIGHCGDVDGMTSNFVFLPAKRFSVSVLSNDENGWDITNGLVWYLMGTDYEEMPNKDTFPDSKLLEGKYVLSMDKFYRRKKPIEPYVIKSVDKNTLEVIMDNTTRYFRQIRPFVYENTSDDSGFYCKKKMYFQIENGMVKKAVIAKRDLIPLNMLNGELLK